MRADAKDVRIAALESMLRRTLQDVQDMTLYREAWELIHEGQRQLEKESASQKEPRSVGSEEKERP